MNTNNWKGKQVQRHGYDREQEIREDVFKKPPAKKQDTDKYDVNLPNDKTYISIKTTINNTVGCADILRIFDYKNDLVKGFTIVMIIVKQIQEGDYKQISDVIEILFTKEFHSYLFGNITRDKLKEYVDYIHSIPSGREAQEKTANERKKRKLALQNKYKLGLTINPKVDSKTQRRTQGSFSLLKAKPYITYQSSIHSDSKKPNICRDVELSLRIYSPPRNKKDPTKMLNKKIASFVKWCKENKINYDDMVKKIQSQWLEDQ
tara:strand:- start:608 stop:1393 length:786 start_codon:yes stop_codon:yes gene_type:complete